MTLTKKRGISWLIAASMTALLMTFVLTCTEVLYSTNDDAGILRAFMGYETGEPASFHIFIHGLLAWPLCFISNLFPNMPWFSYLQMALLALSCTVMAKSIMQCFVNRGRPLWQGAVLAAVFLLTLCTKNISRLTFTQTAALLGAAAVAQMLSIRHDQGAWRVILGMMGALALVCLCYSLRLNALLPMVGFCGLIFVLLVWEHYGLGKWARRSLRPMVISLIVIAVVLGGMVGARELELSDPERRSYLEWQDANTEIMDYIGVHNVPAEAFELVGWDAPMIAMAQDWCFVDSEISTDDFVRMSEYIHQQNPKTLAEKLSGAWRLFLQTASASVQDMRCLSIALVAAVIGLIFACMQKGKRLLLCLSILGILGLAAVMIAYLAISGRLPLRALLIAALPAAAGLFALLPACLPQKGRVLPVVICAVFTAMCIWCMAGTLPKLLINQEQQLELGSPMSDLEEYALGEPDSLILYDGTLSSADLRPFPQFEEDGVPHNLISWGGWGLRSPESIELFSRYDIDLHDLDPAVFLRDDVYIATTRVDPPSPVLLNWLHSRLGDNIDWEIYSEYGMVYILHYYEY